MAIQQMWKSELGIDITITNQEWKVYLDSVTQIDFQIARRGWIGDYVDANNFLDLFITDGGNNNTYYSDPVYDDLILYRAPKAETREERYALFTEAETSVEGLHSNLMDSLNLKYVKLVPGRTLPEALR